MTLQLLAWYSIAAIFVVIFTAKCIDRMRDHHHRAKNPLSTGQEWEQFYLPGDRIIRDNDDSDDFDDI